MKGVSLSIFIVVCIKCGFDVKKIRKKYLGEWERRKKIGEEQYEQKMFFFHYIRRHFTDVQYVCI